MENQVRAGYSVSNLPPIGTGKLSAGEVAAAIKTPKAPPQAQGNQIVGTHGLSALHIYYSVLKNTPCYSQTMKQLLNWLESEEDSETLHALLKQAEKSFGGSKEELARGIQSSFAHASKFESSVFASIKKFYAGLVSPRDKKIVLEFAKAYDGFLSLISANHAVSIRLNVICSLMPQPSQGEFSELIGGYYQGEDYKKILSNLQLLKKQIFPFLNRYVLYHHDFGRIRREISILMHHVIRLETGTYENLKKAAKRLFTLQGFRHSTGIGSDKQLLTRVVGQLKEEQSLPQQQTLRALLGAGLKEESSTALKELTNDALKAMLLSQSCYMPIANVFMLFTKNGITGSFQAYYQQEQENEKKFIFLATIQKLGEVECVLRIKQDYMSVELYGPMALVNRSKEVTQKVEAIIKAGGFKKQNIYIGLFHKEATIATVFSSMDSRRKGIHGEI